MGVNKEVCEATGCTYGCMLPAHFQTWLDNPTPESWSGFVSAMGLAEGLACDWVDEYYKKIEEIQG